ncbi:2'-deoxycytidine 5'-triphosphate deaminase [Candidatus Berkelbacteria bacterium]|nr:2'-deoxycytidine 5'-triphosphate deaminase [Candidatus Berkelbacteria bacterium]
MTESGALPSQFINQIARLGHLKLGTKDSIRDDQVKPASYDLTLGKRAWCVKSTFLPSPGETIQEILSRYTLYEFTMDKAAVLTVGSTFVIELEETFALADDISALVSPKSSSGRINLWVRTLVDGYPRFDRIPKGYHGKIYALIASKSWPIRVRQGDSITQARFFRGNTGRLGAFELKLLNQEVGLLYDQSGNLIEDDSMVGDDGLTLTADLDQPIVAYQAKHAMEVLDLGKIRMHAADDFFIPIRGNKHKEIILRQGEFYILSSFEQIRIPLEYASEMMAYDIAAGEFRSHYAGFFDPGFGYGKNGTIKGTPAVLEILPHENVILRHRQPVCKMIFERLLDLPDRVYGVDIKSNYHKQRGPQLSKHFNV